ncbi:hypothetical protein Vadar_007032 [Vaccinium darrowii]|uniref:Uncharacterized protein n=1 Tax=Vaccinium darrowii TaxID=229202 RepID=A0ACB7WYL0_9ERIC|nr:hypothetical protein Vadar_007032 [Vaccinium darrowii]
MNFVSFTMSQDNMLLDYFCDYTSSATYQTNRDTLLSSLSAGINKYGYYSSSHGEDPDTVYAMVLCRADAELDLCRECINKATAKLVVCPANKPPSGWGEFDPNDKEGIVWYDYCTVRYSSKAMEGIMAGDPRIFVWNVKHNVTSIEQFTDALRNLLSNLRVQAAGGGTQRKFALGNAPGPDNYTIYALTQCTPDLSKQDCSDCLQGAIDNIPLCCKGRVGGRVLRPSCNFRYEIGPFFQEIPAKENLIKEGEKVDCEDLVGSKDRTNELTAFRDDVVNVDSNSLSTSIVRDSLSPSGHGVIGAQNDDGNISPFMDSGQVKGVDFNSTMDPLTYEADLETECCRQEDQDVVNNDLQSTLEVGRRLGVVFVENDVNNIRKMIELEAKDLANLQRSSSS